MMRVELRDLDRRRIGRIDVDPVDHLHRVTVEGPTGEPPREVFLDWDSALDDSGHLRRCVACGCRDLFRARAFPQITGFVLVLAFTGAVLGALGLATTPPILAGMVVVLVADVSILLFSRQRLVCHRCRSSYHGLAIARYHRAWDRSVAERHAPARAREPVRPRAGRPRWLPLPPLPRMWPLRAAKQQPAS